VHGASRLLEVVVLQPGAGDEDVVDLCIDVLEPWQGAEAGVIGPAGAEVEPAPQVFTIGWRSATSVPRKSMELRSSSGTGSNSTGSDPWPVYSSASNLPSGNCSGRNRPVSMLLSASTLPVAMS